VETLPDDCSLEDVQYHINLSVIPAQAGIQN